MQGSQIKKLKMFNKDLEEYSLDTIKQFYNDAKSSGLNYNLMNNFLTIILIHLVRLLKNLTKIQLNVLYISCKRQKNNGRVFL